MDESTREQWPVAALDETARRAGVAGFLRRHPPFDTLPADELDAIVGLVEERTVPAGTAVLVEEGPPGTELFVVRSGLIEMVHGEHVVDVLGAGQVFGHPTLLTGLSPQFTLRAREESHLYAVPFDAAVALLSGPQGAAFVAQTLRERLARTTRAVRDLPHPRSTPVTSLIRRAPVFCEPDTTVRDVARLMDEEVVTAVLVRTGAGLGVITDADLRSKVLAAGVTPEAPASSVMTFPVTTIDAGTLASEAVVSMLQAGVNHVPVVTASGEVLGVVSAGSLMALDELSPFALRWSIAAAHDEQELAAAAARLPEFFVALCDARLDPVTAMRVLTLQSDAITQRLIELSLQRHGASPVPFAWLALGGAARSELTLASDQDNALAYADTDDPEVDPYFERMAREVHEGLMRCGFEADPSGVTAADFHWRMAQSDWVRVLNECLWTLDWRHLMRASLAFDFRALSGDLPITPVLMEVVRRAQGRPQFLSMLARMTGEQRSPFRFRGKLSAEIDLKVSGLRPVTNLARYYALANGVTAPTTMGRLTAVEALDGIGPAEAQSLREAYLSLTELRLAQHAEAVREGRKPDDVVATEGLRPLVYAELHEALKMVAAEQRRVMG